MARLARTSLLAALAAIALVAAASTALRSVDAQDRTGQAPDRTGQAQDRYGQALARLHAYVADDCGPAPTPRSCAWGVHHQIGGVSHAAVVTGATTGETEHLWFAFESLYGRLSGDTTAADGILSYVRNVAMPHDGRGDPPATARGAGAPYLPVLAHWVVDVDGGTRMADTGTVVGPDTPYLPYEEHGEEWPAEPDPDRESYLAPDEWKYASAPDTDQWLAEALRLSYAMRASEEHRDLARRIEASLRPALTTPADFREVLAGFDFGWGAWGAYAGGGARLSTAVRPPGALGTASSMAVTYTVPWSGFGGTGRDVYQDWTAYDGIALELLGEGTGNRLRLLLTDPVTGTVGEDPLEYFEHVITDTVSGWRTIEVPFDSFRERADWPADHATTGNGVLDVAAVRGIALEVLPGTFGDDFEDGDAVGWWPYSGGGASLGARVVEPGAGGSAHALGVTYTVPSGFAGVGASPGADLSGHTALSFDLRGSGTGDVLAVLVAEAGGETWRHDLRDESTEWRHVSIPLAAGTGGFAAAPDQPEGAELDGRMDLAAVADVVVAPEPAPTFVQDFDDGDTSAWWTYSSPRSAVAASIARPGADGTSAALHVQATVRTDGWAGTGMTVDADWRRHDGLRFWLRGEGAARLLVKDGDAEAYAFVVDPLRPVWTAYRPRWADFEGPVGEVGDRRLDLASVEDVVVEVVRTGTTRLDIDELAVDAESPGAGGFALDHVRLEGGAPRSGSGEIRVDELRLTGGPEPPRFPGVMPYTLQWDQDGPIAWRGPLYTGYQDPAAWCLAGDAATPAGMVAFLRAAQDAYDEEALGDARGPFMPLYVQDRLYSSDGDLGWTFDGSIADPNTTWGQFQYRTFARLAHYYYLSGDPDALQVLSDFRAWLAARTAVEGGRVTGIPVSVLLWSGEAEVGYRAGDFALAAQGLLWLAARSSDDDARREAVALLDALLLRQAEDGAFPSDGVRYGYEQAEVGIALALHRMLPGGDHVDPGLAALRGQACVEAVRHGLYLPALGVAGP